MNGSTLLAAIITAFLTGAAGFLAVKISGIIWNFLSGKIGHFSPQNFYLHHRTTFVGLAGITTFIVLHSVLKIENPVLDGCLLIPSICLLFYGKTQPPTSGSAGSLIAG